MVPAGKPDVDTALSILEEAARWLTSRGIDQWSPGSFPRRRILGRIERREMYLAELDGQTFGTLALQWSDEEVWVTFQRTPVTSMVWRSDAASPVGG